MKTIIIYIFLCLASILNGQDLFKVQKVSFNSKSDDFCPFYYQNQIYFCSNRVRNPIYAVFDSSGRRTIDIYYTKRDSTQIWYKPEHIHDINTILNDGPASVYNNLMYISQDDKKSNHLGIYIYKKSEDVIYSDAHYLPNNEHWEYWRPFQYNEDTYNVTHPNISSDGKYFF
jgi:hypothetical protein